MAAQTDPGIVNPSGSRPKLDTREVLTTAEELSPSGFQEFFNSSLRPCVAEFVGLTVFVFNGCMAVQDPVTMNPFLPSAVCVALAHGLTIALLVSSLGGVSGAHLNPAVTLGIALSGGIKPFLAVGYVVAQLLGSLVGAGLVRAVLPAATYKLIGAGAHNLSSGVDPGQGIVCEAVLTMTLVLVVLMCAVDTENNVLAPLAIGFTVTVDILAGIYITGASMNPARSFGPAVVVQNVVNVWPYHYVYWLGPGLGSLLAVCLYRFCLANPEKRLIMKSNAQSNYQRIE